MTFHTTTTILTTKSSFSLKCITLFNLQQQTIILKLTPTRKKSQKPYRKWNRYLNQWKLIKRSYEDYYYRYRRMSRRRWSSSLPILALDFNFIFRFCFFPCPFKCCASIHIDFLHNHQQHSKETDTRPYVINFDLHSGFLMICLNKKQKLLYEKIKLNKNSCSFNDENKIYDFLGLDFENVTNIQKSDTRK
ncbi:hypothetical protein DERF_007081 [Dermatophagoides farinae]|uniref:Uncharacterized protein n=1 Tax=Dermatophagoides farinae TaxID=6954 RepID=A0A922HYC2_DERFA|nr:hypothetical protein DERF_007081 [Dermatophagoides farinae]